MGEQGALLFNRRAQRHGDCVTHIGDENMVRLVNRQFGGMTTGVDLNNRVGRVGRIGQILGRAIADQQVVHETVRSVWKIFYDKCRSVNLCHYNEVQPHSFPYIDFGDFTNHLKLNPSHSDKNMKKKQFYIFTRQEKYFLFGRHFCNQDDGEKMFRALRILTVPAMLFLSTFAHAGDYDFRLHNRSSGWIIDGFYTYQNGRWSKNWLRNPIVAGQGVNMHWASDEGDCVVPFRVHWRDYGSEDHRLDWCKGVSHVYMKDKGFTWN